MSKFISNVIKLFSATLLGQVLGILVTPVLTRLYSPADFGIYQLFFSIVSIIAIISCFSYNSAIMLPKKDEDAANIVILCLFLIVITSVLSTIFLVLFSGYIEDVLNAPGFSKYLLLIPLAIISNSIASVLVEWLSRRDEFSTIAKSNIYSSVCGKGVSLSFGMISPSPFGLISGTIINDATIVFVSLKKTVSDFHFFQNVSYEKIKHLALRYKNFPRYSAGADLASVTAVQVIPFLLAFFFSPIIVGYYALAYMVIVLPSKLMGNSLTIVFFRKASIEKNSSGSVKNLVQSVHKRLVSIGMLICLIIMILGPELFTFALGAQWSTAGIYAQILAPWFFVAFISTPLFSIFNVFEKQVANLWFNVVLLISRIVVLIISGLLNDPILGVLLLSVTGVFFWGWMNMYLLKTAGVSVRDAIYEIIRYLVFGLFICLPLIIAKYYSVPSNMLIFIAMILASIYYLIIIYRDISLKQGLQNFLGTFFHK
jgi:lipopolysaccharide exporter